MATMLSPLRLPLRLLPLLLLVLLLLLQPLPSAPADPYAVLGIPRDATQQQIRKAYRRLSLQNHPDKVAKRDQHRAKVLFDEVSTAYDLVSDADKRQIYDNYGEEKFQSQWQYEQHRRATGQHTTAADFYSANDEVLRVDSDQAFAKTQRGGAYFVEFYAPWCVHCQQMVGAYKKAAILLDGKATMAAVNCDTVQHICHNEQVRSYPTIRFVWPKKGIAEDYTGEHTADAM